MVLGGGGPLGAIIGRYPSAAAGDDEQDPGPGGSVIRHDRKCRDWPFLFLFAAFWVAMIVNSSFGFNQGNPLRYSTHSHSAPSPCSPACLCLPRFAVLIKY